MPTKNRQLIKIRKAKKLSQYDCAFILGITQTEFWKLENGYIIKECRQLEEIMKKLKRYAGGGKN